MRRALGLGDQTSSAPVYIPPSAAPTGTHRPPRRFIQDGEVPVSIVSRDHGDGIGTNKLDAARQALREQLAAREHVEQLLREAQATVRDLQTKLADERIAKDEAVHRAEGEVQTIRDALLAAQHELANERADRQQAEQERDRAVVARRKAEQRLHEVTAVQKAQKPPMAAARATRRPVIDADPVERAAGATEVVGTRSDTAVTTGSADGTVKQARRRGRPPKAAQAGLDFVEWWKPGWRERLR
jgi:hypothetical protein